MFYEEAMINGILNYRKKPTDKWTPFTLEEINKKYAELQIRFLTTLNNIREQLDNNN